MNLTDMVVLVVSLWGMTAEGKWVYMGNQYVQQQPMTLTECSEFIAKYNWAKFEKNPYYKIQLACYHTGDKNE